MALHIVNRLKAYPEPLLFILAAFYGMLLVFFDLITLRISPKDLLDRKKLSDRTFGKLWLQVNTITFQKELETALPSLVAQASGTIIEVGPGSGNQLYRYDKSKITKIYGVEPNAELHDPLRKTIKECGLSDVYTIVPCGVEDLAKLESFGIKEGSIDTVMSVQVFCSVPQPQRMMAALYKLLKPGGQMIVYEHVEAKDRISRAVQGFYQVAWPYLMGNCNLIRPTGDYVRDAGEWSSVDLKGVEEEDPWLVIPHVAGRLVKAG